MDDVVESTKCLSEEQTARCLEYAEDKSTLAKVDNPNGREGFLRYVLFNETGSEEAASNVVLASMGNNGQQPSAGLASSADASSQSNSASSPGQ